MAQSENKRTHPASRVRRFLTWLLRLRGSPRAIARGAAIGMLVAFTPTPGLQIILALGLATVSNANRPIAIVPTWLTNPITTAPVYAFTYYVGSFVWPGPEVSAVAHALQEAALQLASLDFLALRAQLDVFLALGFDVFMGMWIGGLIVGSLAAAITYLITLRTVETLHARRSRRRAERRALRNRRP